MLGKKKYLILYAKWNESRSREKDGVGLNQGS